jgi:hypothetical protein
VTENNPAVRERAENNSFSESAERKPAKMLDF